MKHSRDTSPRTSRARGLVASAVAVAVGVTGLVALATSASASAAPDKYFVCKYVGTPGDGEKLQTGNNPISVSENALPNGFSVGGYFADSQGRSYVLKLDDTEPGPGGDPSVSECPPGDPVDEQPVIVDPAVFTAPTCDAVGTLTGVDTAFYTWARTGPDSAAVLTAMAVGEVTLGGQTAFGPYDLTKLTGEVCLSETPIIPETPVVPQTPVVPTLAHAALAETGFPLLGALGLAGSFSLIGGGLVNARRLLGKSA